MYEKFTKKSARVCAVYIKTKTIFILSRNIYIALKYLVKAVQKRHFYVKMLSDFLPHHYTGAHQ